MPWGTGIAPFLAFIDALEEQDKLERLRIFYSVKCDEDCIDLDRIMSIVKPDKFKLFTTQQENNDAKCRRIDIDDILTDSPEDLDRHYYICGSKEFIVKYKLMLEEKGLPNIYVDEWI